MYGSTLKQLKTPMAYGHAQFIFTSTDLRTERRVRTRFPLMRRTSKENVSTYVDVGPFLGYTHIILYL